MTWKVAQWARDMALQRGRRIAAAEGPCPTVPPARRPTASTGPPHRCGGRGVGHSHSRASRRCFNGAAASLRRKDGITVCISTRLRPLQRGRRIAAAEGSSGSGPSAAERDRASTGPPHRCGGRGSPRTGSNSNDMQRGLRAQRGFPAPTHVVGRRRLTTGRRYHGTIKDLAACEHQRTSTWRVNARGERLTIRRPLADSAHNTLVQAQKSTCSPDHPRGRRRRTGPGLARSG